MIRVGRMGLEAEELREAFRVSTSPAAALAFEAPSDVHFDILLYHPNCRSAREAIRRPIELRRDAGTMRG